MNYETMTLKELKADLIMDAKKGYPFFLAGTLYWLAVGLLGFFFEGRLLSLMYVLGCGSIFPMAIAIGKLLRVNLLTKNPLGVLGGIIGGIQAFFLPVWIVIYMEQYELIPMAIGILGASHFLPYLWIYQSKTYGVLTVLMAVISLVFGYVLSDYAFSLLPFLLAVLYTFTAVNLLMEARAFSPLGDVSKARTEQQASRVPLVFNDQTLGK